MSLLKPFSIPFFEGWFKIFMRKEPVLFPSPSLCQNIDANVKFNICNHMKISLENSLEESQVMKCCFGYALERF